MVGNATALMEAINLLCGVGRPELAKVVAGVWTASQHDELTGLFNKATFEVKMDREVDRARPYRRDLSVITIDVDHFKTINDTHGHIAGDDVLRWVGNMLLTTSRSSDYCARSGGDEFVIITPESALDGAVHVANRLRDALGARTIATRAGPVEASITVGTATLQEGESADELLDRADQRILDGKRARPEGIERRSAPPLPPPPNTGHPALGSLFEGVSGVE